ncbi:MAG: hypothetical protein GW748_07145 [Alphaproteobacteria bacterium]|nr:hypothetical protein [Alphaproteobacteria bacterium]
MYLLLIFLLIYAFPSQAKITEETPSLAKSCPFGDSVREISSLVTATAARTPHRNRSSLDDTYIYDPSFKKKNRDWFVGTGSIERAKALKGLESKQVGLGKGKASLKEFYSSSFGDIELTAKTGDTFNNGKRYTRIYCEYNIPLSGKFYGGFEHDTKNYVIQVSALFD